jgi:hypothetical protein
MMMQQRIVLCVLATLALGGAAHARSPLRKPDGMGSVTACSRYGNGCYTAPLRAGKLGPEMGLKGGTWIDCKGDCSNTLREETVDFWDTQREKTPSGGR